MSTSSAPQKVLAHLRMSNEIAKRHQNHLEKTAAVSAAARQAAPEAIAALVANERVFEHQQEAVLEKIAGSHVACLELIRDLAKHRNAAELDSIGSPAGQEKTASAGSSITGAAVADFDETESGDAFRRKLLGQ